MRMMRVALALLCLCPIAALGATLSLAAEPGQFNAKTLGPVSESATLTATLRLTDFRGTHAWPSGAYAGFHEGTDRNNSVQFVLMRNKATDSQLATGYRIVKDGKELDVQFLDWLPMGSQVNIKVSFTNGLVMLSVENGKPIRIQTPFHKVAPYVSVSSGGASFEVMP